MITENINNCNNRLVNYGTPLDVCILCSREKAMLEKVSVAEARIRLDGHLEHKKIVKIPVSGTTIAICLDHIRKLADENKIKTDEPDQDVLVNCYGGCGSTLEVKASKCVEAYLCSACVQNKELDGVCLSALAKNKEVADAIKAKNTPQR